MQWQLLVRMMTSSNETFSALMAFSVRNSSVTGEFPTQRAVTQRFVGFFTCVWTNSWANNRDAGDLRRHSAHYDVILMSQSCHPHYDYPDYVYTERERSSWWLPCASQETLKPVFYVPYEDQGSHPYYLSVSVYIYRYIIYISYSYHVIYASHS